MKKFYYNTTKDNKDNFTIGYLTNFGDFVCSSERKKYEEAFELFGTILTAEIIVEGGLLSGCESYDSYCLRVAEIARQQLQIS